MSNKGMIDHICNDHRVPSGPNITSETIALWEDFFPNLSRGEVRMMNHRAMHEKINSLWIKNPHNHNIKDWFHG